MSTKKYKKGEIVFMQGDVESCMYDVISGSFGVYDNYGTAGAKLLTTLSYGSFFGEIAMVEGSPRTATVVALEDSTAAVIEKDGFADYFRDKPRKVIAIMSSTSERVRSLTKDYIHVCGLISEYVACEEKGEKPSAELMKELKRIAR